MQKPIVICVTPVLNEAWILERFLKCTSLWADHIIVADQQSTDGSREIAKRFPKVRLVENPGKKYDEQERQRRLLAEARQIPGPRLVVALDADEFLTANFLTSPEWNSILQAPPGTVVSFQWVHVETNFTDFNYNAWAKAHTVGFMDDGSDHQGKVIHSVRVPLPPGARTLQLKEIKLMHYCNMDRGRYESRIRWYQCWEQLNLRKRPLELYRYYHVGLSAQAQFIKPVPQEWIQGYAEHGIDMTSVIRVGYYWWDNEVLQFFDEHGTARFKRLAIWDVNWGKLYGQLHPDKPKKPYPDPRSRFDRVVHRWLRRTQPHYLAPSSSQRLHYWMVQKALRILGW